MRSTTGWRAVALLLTLLLVVAACSSDEDAPAEEGASDDQPAATATVTIADFDFGAPLTVAAGTTVEVVNADEAAHTFTAQDRTFDSGTIAAGETFSTTLDTPGEYALVCTIHPEMAGSITVEG